MPVSVYLVEDEEWIRKGIKKMIRWEELGLALSGEAEDGLTAREEILRIRPQIIISDIRIPRLDGLALVREIQKVCPVKAIFISGYRKFEYARQAIELEAVSYILKPVEKEELNHVLKQTVEALTREQKNRKDADYGKASFLMDVLDERVSDASLSLRTQKTDNCNHCVLLIPGKEPKECEEGLKTILGEREDRMTEAKLFRKGKEEWVIIFSSRNKRQFQERARRLAHVLKERTGSRGSWVLGGTVTGFAGIPVSYHQAFGIATAAAGDEELRDGHPVLRVLDGQEIRREYLFACYGRPGTPRFKCMVRSGSWKYIWLANGGREQLFDLSEHRREDELFNEIRPDILRQLRRTAERHCRREGLWQALAGTGFLEFPYEERPKMRICQFDESSGVYEFIDKSSAMKHERSARL